MPSKVDVDLILHILQLTTCTWLLCLYVIKKLKRRDCQTAQPDIVPLDTINQMASISHTQLFLRRFQPTAPVSDLSPPAEQFCNPHIVHAR
jgi:hypothetical protein